MTRRDRDDINERRAQLQRDRAARRSELEARARERSLESRRADARRTTRSKSTANPPARRRAAQPPRGAGSRPMAAAGSAAVRANAQGLPARIIGGSVRMMQAFVQDVADIFTGTARVVSGGLIGCRPMDALAGGDTRAGTASRGGGTRRRTLAQERARQRQRSQMARRLRFGAALAAAGALLVGWFTVPALDAFRISQVAVVGATSLADLQVRQTVDPLLAGETVYTVDTELIERRLERMPFVRDARVSRHFPGGIEVRIFEYQPLAIGSAENGDWLVARDGRVLTKARIEDWQGRVPRVQLTAEDIKPGVRVGSEPALRLLRAVPDDFLGTFQSVDVRSGTLVGTLGDGTQIRFGRSEELPVKIAAAQRTVEFWVADRSERTLGEPAYVDVSVPALPAVKVR